MRITNGMMSKNLLNNLQLNMKRMSKLNQQAASGKLFDNPSDAPVAMAKSLKLYTDVSRVHQYERNLRDAQSWLSTTENALHEMGEIFQRTRELSVDMANGTKTESDTQKAAAEIKQLKDQMIKLANTTHAGRSIFTGYQTDKELLNKDGTYKIDITVEQVSTYNVGVAENLEVNILGSKLFGIRQESAVTFNNIDGTNNLTIDLGSQNKDFKGMEITVKSGDQADAGAVWSNGNLTITLDNATTPPATIDATSILGLLNPGPISGNKPEGFDTTLVTVTVDPATPGTIDGTSIVEKTISTGGTNTEVASGGQKSHLIDIFDQLIAAMGVDGGDSDGEGVPKKFNQEEVSNLIGEIDNLMENTLTLRAEVGAKTNRLEMTSKRLSSEELNFTTVLSENEDVDEAEIIMKFKMAEAVYNASLAMGGRTIQSTLVDFLR